MRVLLLALLLCGCTASAQSRPTVTPVTVPTAQLDPGVIVWPFPLTPEPAYPAPLQAQDVPGVLTVTHTPQGVRVTWSAPVVVCPWLESGAVKLYAGGDKPCRPTGSAVLSYVPDPGARIVLRDTSGAELASVRLAWVQVLPIVVKE